MDFVEQLESLYSAERDRLFTYALSVLGNEGRSEDVVHDVFRRLCESPVQAGDLRAFVYRCVRNRALDLLRGDARRKNNPGAGEPTSIYAIGHSVPWEGMLSEQRARQVEKGLQSLRVEEREVVVLHIHSEMTFEAISALLEAPLGTVASRYRRALAKLRKTLKGEMSP